jgi:predicted phage-related endonuclease
MSNTQLPGYSVVMLEKSLGNLKTSRAFKSSDDGSERDSVPITAQLRMKRYVHLLGYSTSE